MKIIDAHTHCGLFEGKDCSGERLREYCQKLNVIKLVSSPLYGMEFDSGGAFLAHHASRTALNWYGEFVSEMQVTGLDFRGLVWIRPHSEVCSPLLEQFLAENRQRTCGLKVHPFHSRMNLMDKRIAPYLELAHRLRLVVTVHVASDEFSLPHFVLAAAELYPNATFIMAHLGLNTDNSEAISLLGRRPNLFGDTSWVQTDKVLHAAAKWPYLVFGTDAPLGYEDEAWRFYQDMLKALEKNLPRPKLEAILWRNAEKLFGF